MVKAETYNHILLSVWQKMINRKFWLVLLLASSLMLVALPQPVSAQVIFIDTDAVKNAAKALPLDTPVHLTVAVIRFLPQGKAARQPAPIPTNSTMPKIVETLGKRGQVNLLFFGERDLSGPSNAVVRINSTERRPAFSLDADTNQVLTNREFGLHLEISAHNTPDQRLLLDWNGNFSWSPDLMNTWAGEKYLLFGMKVAGLIKPGSVYSDEDDEDAGQGINIGGLFKRKPKKTEAKAPPDLSFLAVERRATDLKGRYVVTCEELIISATPSPNQDPEQPEYIYLVQQVSRSY
jgi:hypothetical protein